MALLEKVIVCGGEVGLIGVDSSGKSIPLKNSEPLAVAIPLESSDADWLKRNLEAQRDGYYHVGEIIKEPGFNCSIIPYTRYQLRLKGEIQTNSSSSNGSSSCSI